MNQADLEGIIPATIVPMRADYSIDFPALETYLDWVVSQDPVGLAVNVDTGEGPYLTAEERSQVIHSAKKASAGKCFVVAGVGGPGTLTAVNNAKAALDDGADALLVFPTPAFLNDPLDERIAYEYHRLIAEASGLPLIVFQLGPVFGGLNYPPETLEKVLTLPQVIGLKDASFDAQRFCLTRDIAARADHPVTLLTGNDNFMLESFLLGAKGGLLGYAAVGVGLLVEQLKAVQEKQFDRAASMQARVQGLCNYIYARPLGDYRARCKVALVHMGLLQPCQAYVRPPFLSLWEMEKDRAFLEVQKAGLLDIAKIQA